MLLRPGEVDFAQLIAQLQAVPLSFSQIAERAEVSKSSLVMLSSGSHAQPLHANGERLVEFWCRVTNRRREDLPRVRSLL